MARPYLGGSSGGVKAVNADVTLAIADSGKTIFMSEGAAAYDITLPAVSNKGWQAKFILVASPASNDIDIKAASGDEDKIKGIEFSDSDTASATDSDWDKITFSTNGVAGDYVDVISDGTSWYMHIHASADNSVTQTD